MNVIKNKILPFVLMIIILATTVTSCNDKEWLEDYETSSNEFNGATSTQGLERMVTGAYWLLGGINSFRGLHGMQYLPAYLYADEGDFFDKGANASSREWWNRELVNTNSNLERTWESGYAVISQVNQIITTVEENGGQFQDSYGATWTPRILGEAHFLRAYSYFELVRIFGKPYGADNSNPSIILKTKPEASTFDFKGLSSVEEVYNQILFDLEKAVELLPLEPTTSNAPPAYSYGRANKYAAYFLATRIYMQMHNFEKAEEYANLLLESGKFVPTEDPLKTWNEYRTNMKSNETVWYYINHNPQTRWKAPQVTRTVGYTRDGRWLTANNLNSEQAVSVSKSVLEKVGWADTTKARLDKRYTQLYVRVEAGKDLRPQYKSITTRKVWSNKYSRGPSGNIKGDSVVDKTYFGLIAHQPMMRSAEIYLTRSILRFKRGDLQGAADDLNVIRKRAWDASKAGVPYTPIAAGEITEEMIHNERLAEMLFEVGDRLYYLQALQMDIPAYTTAEGNVRPGISWQSFDAPVPLTETQQNPQITE